MKKIWVIIKREFITRVMTKGFIIGTLLVPVIMVAFFGIQIFLLSQEKETSRQIGVVDKSGILLDKLNEAFQDTLKDGRKKYQFIPIEITAEENLSNQLITYIQENVFDIIMVIPSHIADSGKVIYYAKKLGNYELLNSFRNAISTILTEYNYEKAGIDISRLKELKVRIDIETIKVTKEGAQKSSAMGEYLTGFFLLMLLYMTLLLYGQYIWKGIVEDKISRIVEILLSSITPTQFMYGKIFGNAFIGLAQIAIWAVFGGIVLIGTLTMNPQVLSMIHINADLLIYFIIFFLLGFFLYSTFFAIIGAVSGSMDDAQQLQSPFMFLIIIAFLVAISALNNPDAPYIEILSFIPFFTPIVMFARIIVSEPSIYSIIISVLLSVGFIVLMTILAAKIFRIGILMTGKRPTLPEFLRWVRS